MDINIFANIYQKSYYHKLQTEFNCNNYNNQYLELEQVTLEIHENMFRFHFPSIITSSHYVVISPKIAAALFALQHCNRSYNIRHVEQLMHDSETNNNCPELNRLILAKDGRLIDGQHTLLSIIRSNRATKVLVLQLDLDYSEIVKFLDQNKKQTLPQTLTRCGYRNPGLLASIIRSMFYYDHTMRSICPQSYFKASDPEVINYYENNYSDYIDENFTTDLKKFFKYGNNLNFKPIVVSFAYMSIFNKKKYDVFRKLYVDNVHETSISNLRNAINKIIDQKLILSRSNLYDSIFQLLIIGWNSLMRNDKDIKSMEFYLEKLNDQSVIDRSYKFLKSENQYYCSY